MFAASYVIVFAFYPHLKLDQEIMEKSYDHSLEELTSLNYLTREQFSFLDKTKPLKLKDFALVASARRNKIAISAMFSTELKSASDCLLKWFYKKYMKKNLELSNLEKIRYQTLHPIDWKERYMCYMCRFLLKTEISGIDASETEMSYLEFFIRKEHMFLRNIYSVKEINRSKKLKNLKKYYEAFKLFLKTSSSTQVALITYRDLIKFQVTKNVLIFTINTNQKKKNH